MYGDTALAQFDLAGPFPTPDGGGATPRSQWVLKFVGAAVIGLIGFLFSFYGVLPMLLQRRVWPLTAFGWACAVSWLLFWAGVLLCFWKQLVLPGRSTFINLYAVRAGVVVLALALAVVFTSVFRSDHEPTAAGKT